MQPVLHYRNHELYMENVSLQALTEGNATPFYIYSRRDIVDNCKAVMNAARGLNVLPCYALKANYNPAILKIIKDMGFGADVVSGGELYFALKAGFDKDKIVFAGVGKTAEEIEYAIQIGIHSLNVESEEELKLTGEIAEQLQSKPDIALRVNPNIDAKTHKYISTGLYENKFGIMPDQAVSLYQFAVKHPWLNPVGIHVHIGSQIKELSPFTDTIAFLKNFKQKLADNEIPITQLDLGGGIGINYDKSLHNLQQPSTYIDTILPQYLQGLQTLNSKLILELGRSIVGSAGLLITKIIYRKKTPSRTFLITDAAMNNLIRPSLYNAHHEIYPLTEPNGEWETVDVVGPVCESSDYFAKNRNLPQLEGGQIIALAAAGAYGQALSSNYNLRPRIAEYLVNNDTVNTIAEAQSIEDIANQYKW
ncbi:MAG: diaminopimelate decarboxylase [Caldithrix sp.]|nr:diaminopimelate decarboxylase [Caldithrix sp.]